MLAGLASLPFCFQPVAQAAQVNAARSFDIPAQPLATALNAFGRQSGLQVTLAAATSRGVVSRAVNGTLTPQQALARMLAGTGISFDISSDRTAVVGREAPVETPLSAPDGTIELDPVIVQAGANSATTEGSGAYNAQSVTVAGKIPVPIQEIPNSVSVLTRQRLEDQNLNTVDEALRQATGVTAVNYGDGTSYFSARGYQLDAQYDGMPVSSGIQYQQQFDMAIYDRAEVLRGPAGLLQGTGGPAGTVNFVRRMPLDHFSLSTDTQYGSWNFLRQTIDLTGPLNKEGTIRGRVIVAGQDRDFFYDKAKEWHGTAYGALQVDLSPQTTLSLSGVYQKQRFAPFDYGQSLYTNGAFLNAPRSAFFGADWSYNNFSTAEGYADLKHTFDNGWVSNTSLLYRDMRSNAKYAYMTDGVNPATNTSDYALQSGVLDQKWLGVDTNISGSFELFGRESQFLLGANYSYRDKHQLSGYMDGGVYEIYSAHATIPYQNVPFTYGQDSRTQEAGLYGQTRLKLLDPLTVVLGGRFSWYGNEHRNLIPATGTWTSDPSVNGKFTPYAGIVYQLNKTYAVYASYSDIFTPQADPTFTGQGLQPRVGSQYEVGVKGTFLDGRLNATLAAFNIDDNHRAVADLTNPIFSVDAGKARSRGIEAEVSGEILPGWNLTAGYTYLQTKYLSDPSNAGMVLDPEEPKHAFKLWSKYTFEGGRFEGLSLGAGLRAYSRTQRGSPTGPSDMSSQGAYAVVDAQLGYKLNDHFEGTVTVKNLLDRKYFDRLPTRYFGIYGEPRSFLVSLKSHW
ncbi:hypothetical protein BA190_08815 [Labrys sp. WJW]|uniref:TonB-dependent siderophore receptor n=1 Tax=Labrys sp. WJW TaxID=1737983 RepID=UPI00082C63B6|nr:TonB-dependent siderophore receptor [Labrys sp. WJW]OCC05499.1 hypothetical protein BA190_08815 [Labrys sp. WJW]